MKMEENSNGCAAMVQESDGGSDDAASKRPHVSCNRPDVNLK